jgi:hypothetical protein
MHLSVQNAVHGTPTFYCAKTKADALGAVRNGCGKRATGVRGAGRLVLLSIPFFARRDHFVLLSIPLSQPGQNFVGAQLKPPAKVGRTPWSAAGPLASLPTLELTAAPFAACRYVGQHHRQNVPEAGTFEENRDEAL